VPAVVVAAVDEDPREPRRRGGGIVELVKPLEPLDEAVLDRVLRVVPDQPPGDRVEAG